MGEWQVGDARITAVVEQPISGLNLLISQAKPEAVAQIDWLRPHFADEEGELFGLVQCFVIEIGGKIGVVDTCVGDGKDLPYSPDWHRKTFDLLGKFRAAGFAPETVDFVLCTHLHLDHVGLNTRLENGEWVPTFPNARYLFARSEYEHWTREAEREIPDPNSFEKPFDRYQAGFMLDQRNVHRQSVEPVIAAGLADLVDPPCEVVPGVRLVPTNGHTPGHVSVEIASSGAKALITGDAFHHPCQIARHEWATVADYDREASTATRKRMLEEVEDSDTLFLGTHFAEPTGGTIARDGDSWKLIV